MSVVCLEFAKRRVIGQHKRPSLEWLYRHLITVGYPVNSEAQHSCHQCRGILDIKRVLDSERNGHYATCKVTRPPQCPYISRSLQEICDPSFDTASGSS